MLASNLPAILIITLGIVSFWAAAPNMIAWILTAEIIWIGLYVFYVTAGAQFDALTFAVCGLVILCLATSESAIGLALLIYNFTVTGNIHGATTRRNKNTRNNSRSISKRK